MKKSNALNILYDYQILNSQKYGGISRYFYELASRLNQKQGVNADVATAFNINHYFESYFKKEKPSGLPSFLKCGNNVVNRTNVLFRNRRKYQIIHPTYYHPYILNKFKGKLVVTVHDMIYELFPEKMGCAEIIIANKKAHIFSADKIICVSECTKRDLMHIYPEIPEEKIAVIYHGNSMNVSLVDCKPLRDLPEKYVLFMGQRGGYKNFKGLAEAMAPLMQTDENLWLVCGGGGVFTEEERSFLFEKRILERCKQINYSDEELPNVYNRAQCFVFPSMYEGFGIPILEAWSCRCPLILSNASCFPEIAGEAGVYFDGENALDMQEKIARVLSDSTLRKEMMEKGLERLKLYSWEKTVDETLKIYESLLN